MTIYTYYNMWPLSRSPSILTKTLTINTQSFCSSSRTNGGCDKNEVNMKYTTISPGRTDLQIMSCLTYIRCLTNYIASKQNYTTLTDKLCFITNIYIN
jgi:hypothetical protein